MRGGRDCADNPERRVFFESDAVIATQRGRVQPLHPGDELNNLELLDFVIEAANLGFFQFDAPPLTRVGISHGFDDVNDLSARLDAFLLQLRECVRCGSASLGGVIEDAEVFAGAVALVTAAVGFAVAGGWTRCGSRRASAETAQNFLHHVPD